MQREKGMTVGVWAEQWFTQRVGKWSPNTESGYRNLIYNHIIPGVDRAGLTDLTERRIQNSNQKCRKTAYLGGFSR